jgi:hypothetical protein
MMRKIRKSANQVQSEAVVEAVAADCAPLMSDLLFLVGDRCIQNRTSNLGPKILEATLTLCSFVANFEVQLIYFEEPIRYPYISSAMLGCR